MREELSKTVRIDLMPSEVGKTVSARNNMLAHADFSTRKRQKAKASDQVNSRYEELLESVYDAAVIASPVGKIIEVNGRAIEFLGYDRDQLCGGMSMSDLIDGADDEVMRSISDTLLTDRFALLQAFCSRKDGSLFPAEIAVNRLSMDHVRLCFFIRDVSLRYQTEEQLRMEHAALQICASGIAICSTAGILDFVNPAFGALVGRDPDEIVGQNIREILPNAEHVQSLIDSAVQSDEAWGSEFPVALEDGTVMMLQVAASCIFAEDGAPRGIVFAMTDVTGHHKASDIVGLDALHSGAHLSHDELIVMQEELQSRIASFEKELSGIEGRLKEEE